jgi:hypothetical protein
LRLLTSRRLGYAALIGVWLVPVGAQAATRSFTLTDFDSVRLEAPIAVSIQSRKSVAARGEGDIDLLDRLELVVTSNLLTIRLKPSPFAQSGRKASGPVRLFLSAPKLRRLQLEGAGSLTSDGMEGQRTDIISSGSGTVRVSGIASDTLYVAQLGAGSVSLAGKAGNAVMRLSGTGALDAKALNVLDLNLTLDGASSAAAQAIRAAKISAVGAGSVTVDGKAACTVRHAGSGAVSCGGKDF